MSGVLVWMSSPGQSGVVSPGANLCTPGEGVDCHYVLGSRWGRIGPIPTAVLGFAYFAMVAFWFAVIGIPNRIGRRWHFVPFVLTSLGFCSSLWFTYVMASELPVWCTWCVAAHVVNGLMWLLTTMMWPRSAGKESGTSYPSNLRAGLVLGISGTAVVIIFLSGLSYAQAVSAHRLRQKYLEVTSDIEYIAWRHSQSTVHEIPIRSDDPVIGKVDAPFTLVVFSDFECVKCAEFHHNIHSLVSQFSGTLRCVFRHYPMSTKCNSNVERDLHYFACAAAFAAEAARVSGTREQHQAYDRLLYKNRKRFDEKPYPFLAAQTGIDPESFSAALSSDATRRRVLEDVALGGRLGVEGTPYLFLNGRRLADWRILTKKTFQPQTDVQQTLLLWERLLGRKAVINRGRKSEASGGDER